MNYFIKWRIDRILFTKFFDRIELFIYRINTILMKSKKVSLRSLKLVSITKDKDVQNISIY